jgi:hypothetical protein
VPVGPESDVDDDVPSVSVPEPPSVLDSAEPSVLGLQPVAVRAHRQRTTIRLSIHMHKVSPWLAATSSVEARGWGAALGAL